jgi:glycosyltransferase involved in cell wall biosynthesis
MAGDLTRTTEVGPVLKEAERTSSAPFSPTAPAVSVVVPCYNAAATLDATVMSVLAQTEADWELICVDDESSDTTPERLHAWSRRDARIRWLRAVHGGLASTRNHGAACAAGRWLLFLDADDVLRPDALRLLLRAARRAGDGFIVAGGYELLSEDGRPLGVYSFPQEGTFTPAALIESNRLPATSLVPRAVAGARPYDASLKHCGEDWDLWLRLAHQGVGCVTIPRVVYGYRLRRSSLSHQAERLFASGRFVLDRWTAGAADEQLVALARRRCAWLCGAIAAAAGDRAAIWSFLLDAPVLSDTRELESHVGHAIQWAFQFVHGAEGRTWRDYREAWLAEARAWLLSTPLADRADAILAEGVTFASDPHAIADTVVAQAASLRPARIVVYGTGRNGLTLLEQLRTHPRLSGIALAVADDFAPPGRLDDLDLPVEEPRRWATWPSGTLVLVTPNEWQSIATALSRVGGREGRDYLVLAKGADGGRVPVAALAGARASQCAAPASA